MTMTFLFVGGGVLFCLVFFTVHSCISHLGCPGAVDPMCPSGVTGSVRMLERQSELEKLLSISVFLSGPAQTHVSV